MIKIIDFPKIESPFKRILDKDNDYIVIPEIIEGCEWVFEGKEDEVLCTEKLDGCLHYFTPILTDKGIIEVGKIVNQKLKVNILSYNFKEKVTEFKPILNYHKEKNINGFLCVNAKQKYHGTIPVNLKVTSNHKFWTENGWKRADNLKIKENVYHIVKKLDFIRQQIILGTLLGDTSISWSNPQKNCGFDGSHSIKQNDYFNLKLRLLGNLIKERKKRYRGGFKGSSEMRRYYSVITKHLSEFISENCINMKTKKREIKEIWAKKLTPISFAFWYMDDGSLCKTNKTNITNRATISANRYTKKELKRIQTKLLEFNISSNIQNSKTSKGNTLQITSQGSEIFFNLIAPYIIKSMQYKLPEYLRTGNSFWDTYSPQTDDDIIKTEILKISKTNKKQVSNSNYQYDLEIKDNSNYFAGGILVHNSNVSIIIEGGKITRIFNRTNEIPFFNKGSKHIVEAVLNSFERGYCDLTDGQYFGEVIGVRVNGNPYKLTEHLWIPFLTYCREHLAYKSWHKYPKTFLNISNWFEQPISEGGIFSLLLRKKGIEAKPEGVVFHNLKTGQMAKLRLDMFKWFKGDKRKSKQERKNEPV